MATVSTGTPPAYTGDRWMLQDYGWQLFALLLLIAGACAYREIYCDSTN